MTFAQGYGFDLGRAGLRGRGVERHHPAAETGVAINQTAEVGTAQPGTGRESGGAMQLRSKLERFGVAGIVLCVAIAAGLTILLVSRHATPAGNGLANTSGPAGGNEVLRLKGMTEAVEKRAIQTPLLAGERSGTLTVIKLTPAGTAVKRGDILVEFDRQAQLLDYLDKQAASNDLVNKVAAAEQNEDAARAKDLTEMKEAEDNLGKAQLEVQKVEILSRIDAEKAQENLDEAKATLAQLQQTFDLKRKAAQASIRILQIQLDRNRETMQHAQANAALLEVHSPLDGIVVLNTIWKQGNMGEVQEGDQVRSGVAFMQVVDPSRMDVQVTVNQEDLLGLKIGQSASVHLDAYPGLEFQGQLESLGPMGRTGDFSNKVRSFSAVFSIAGHDPRLMPDLSAAVDVKPNRGVGQ
jgi:multidrug resistance efflux pump